MSKSIESIRTYSDLLEFLAKWRSAEDPEVYDFGGIVHLWLACMDNIRTMAVEGELEDLGAYLEEDQKEFLSKAARLVEQFVDDED